MIAEAKEIKWSKEKSTSGEVRIMKGKTVLQRKYYHNLHARADIIRDWKRFYGETYYKLPLAILPDTL
jgi:hypothetical protein